jgi:hypothetical protein
MAKQTFTTGQVLTAAQMTSLQQTAMLGGAATAKTASYTLVAADAGSAISMSNASATTITVNTGLFAAGDTVQITNLGVGVCTITAGTATVNTSASLALAQYESGTLDFTSTSAAIFIKGAGASAAGGGMTLLSTTTLSGATTTISSIDQTYNDLYVYVSAPTCASNGLFRIAPNGSASVSIGAGVTYDRSTATTYGNNFGYISSAVSSVKGNDTQAAFTCVFPRYNAGSNYRNYSFYGGFINPSDIWYAVQHSGLMTLGAAISSLVFSNSAGNLTGGTVYLYGVK